MSFSYVVLGFACFFELFVTSVVNKGRVSDNRGKRVFILFGTCLTILGERLLINCKTNPTFLRNYRFFQVVRLYYNCLGGVRHE